MSLPLDPAELRRRCAAMFPGVDRTNVRGLLAVFDEDHNALYDAVLDGVLPQPWLGEARFVIDRQDLQTRALIRLEQAILARMAPR